MKYGAETCYVEAAYDADFDYATEIRINCQNRSYSEDYENMKCQYFSIEIKYEAEIC